MHVTKHHGLGNDFLVALVEQLPPDGPQLARQWCHRTTGIGADGLIFGTPSETNDLAMTLFNADGSMAEISGNGIRCLAQAEAMRQHTNAVELQVETGSGVRHLVVEPGKALHDGTKELLVRVDMGPVTTGPDIPEGFTPMGAFQVQQMATAAVGNPHLVLQVDSLDAVDLAVDGPANEASFMPEGINVHFLVPAGDDTIEVHHWERGVGITSACGSGASVSATIAHGWGLVGNNVNVIMPGGRATVLVGERVTLVGPAVHIASLEIELPHG